MSKPLSSDLVGATSGPVSLSWKKKDVLLYACAVGARPDTELDFLYEGRGPKVLPTYAVMRGGAGTAALFTNGVKIKFVKHALTRAALTQRSRAQVGSGAFGRDRWIERTAEIMATCNVPWPESQPPDPAALG